MQIPIIGFKAFSALGIGFLLGLLLILANWVDPIRQLPGLNAIPKQTALIIGILLVIGTLAWGGVLTAPQDEGTVTEPTDYYSTTDISIYSYDAYDGSDLSSGDIQAYDSGFSNEEYVKETADLLRSNTGISSGEETMSGWDAEKYPTATFVYDSSSYYQTIDEEDIRVEKDAEENTKSVTIRASKIGTIDGSSTDTSPSWSESDDDVSYNIYVENTASDTVLRNMAIEWDAADNGSADLLSVDDGAHMETVDGQNYIVLDNTELEGNDVEVISVSVDPGYDHGDVDLEYDDLFGQFGADAFATHSNIQSSSSSTVSVSW